MATPINASIGSSGPWTAPADCTVVIYYGGATFSSPVTAGSLTVEVGPYSDVNANPIVLAAGQQVTISAGRIAITGWTV